MNTDRFVALCCLIIGLLISVGSVRLGLGNFRAPQAGLFPFLVGLGIILLSVILLKGEKRGKEILILETRWKNLVWALGSLIFYALLLNWLGFAITTFVFMVLILKTIESQKWVVALMIAFFSTSITYLVFSLWLEIEFPRGIMGR